MARTTLFGLLACSALLGCAGSQIAAPSRNPGQSIEPPSLEPVTSPLETVTSEPTPRDTPEPAASSKPGPVADLTSLAYSSDGALLAVARASWMVAIVDVHSGNELARFRAPGSVTGLVWSADGSAVGLETHNGVLVWDVARAEPRGRVFGNERVAREPRRSMKLAPDLKTAARLDEAGRVEILSVDTGEKLRVLPTAARGILGFVPPRTGPASGPSRELLALESARSIDLVELERGAVIRILATGGRGVGEPEGDGRYVVVRGNFTTEIVDLVRGRVARTFAPGASLKIDRRRVLVGTYRGSQRVMMAPLRVSQVIDLERATAGPENVGRGYERDVEVLAGLLWRVGPKEAIGADPSTGRAVRKLTLPEGARLLQESSPRDDSLLFTANDGGLLVVGLDGEVRARIAP